MKMIPDPQVRAEFGVTAMTIWRWEHDPRLGFPKAIRIRGRKYRDADELEAFRAARREAP